MPRAVPRQESRSALTPNGESSVSGVSHTPSVRQWPARFWLISGAVHLLLFVAVSFVLRDTFEAPLTPAIKVTVMTGNGATSLLDDVSVIAPSRRPERRPPVPDLLVQTAPVQPDPVPVVPSTPMPPPVASERATPPMPVRPTPPLLDVGPELQAMYEPELLRPPTAPPPPVAAQSPLPRPSRMAPTREVPKPPRPSTTFDDTMPARVPPAGQQLSNPPATSAPDPRAADATNPASRPTQVASARYDRNPAPAYPSEARRRGWEGRVLLSVEILENGRPERVTVKQSSGYSVLDEAAMGAVRRWTFIPAQRDGQPIRSLAEVPIVFSLRNRR